MPILIGLGAGAGVGLTKYWASDLPSYNNKKQLAAATARYSPWTGLKPDMPNAPSALGDLMSGATSGALIGQGIGNAQLASSLAGSQVALNNAQAGLASRTPYQSAFGAAPTGPNLMGGMNLNTAVPTPKLSANFMTTPMPTSAPAPSNISNAAQLFASNPGLKINYTGQSNPMLSSLSPGSQVYNPYGSPQPFTPYNFAGV